MLRTEPHEGSLVPELPVDVVKRRAKMLRKRFDPDKALGLQNMHKLVARCLGRSVRELFSACGFATPAFPKSVPFEQWPEFQRQRELDCLSEVFPEVTLEELEQFVSQWSLVRWHPRVKQAEDGELREEHAESNEDAAEVHGHQKPVEQSQHPKHSIPRPRGSSSQPPAQRLTSSAQPTRRLGPITLKRRPSE